MTSSLTDRRLIPLADALAQGAYDVLSVDVFDTLLWRRVPEPKDAFFRLGQSLIEKKIITDTLSPVAFADLRAAAEKGARAAREAQTGSREVLLSDIYAVLPGHVWAGEPSPGMAADTEVDLEAASMVLDQDIIALLEAAQSAGVRVVLASDTYFTRGQLLRFLTAAGLGAESVPETLYISNEHGRPKWRDLFDLILEDLKISPDKLIHVGDNVDADVAPCMARGIHYLFYDKWAVLPRTQNHELTRTPEQRAQWICGGGDQGLTGLRSRLGHRAPPSLAAEHEPYWCYGAVHLAPIFAAYGRWVLDTIEQSAADAVFGIMREGRFLNRVIATVAKNLGRDTATKELWLSRRAVVRAALWPDDFSYLAQAITYCPGPTTDDILRQLGISRADLAETFKDPAAVELHAPDGLEALLTAISRSQTLQQKIAAESQKRRTALLEYLSQQTELGSGETLFVMDLGYAGTIQTALHKIFERENVSCPITGLYTAINAKGQENRKQGADLRALYGDDGFAVSLVKELERTPDVLEHACMCEDGSLETFDPGGVPVFLENQRDETQFHQMTVLQGGIIAGVNAIMDLLGDESAASQSFVDHAGEIIRQAMLRPTRQEADTIGQWLHEANFDLTDRRTIADLRTDPAKLELGDGATWLNIERHEAYWPAAALQRVAPHLAEPAAVLRENSENGNGSVQGALLGTVMLCPDIGVDFDDRRQMAAPLIVFSDGRGEVTCSIKPFGPEAYQAVRVSLPKVKSEFTVNHCAVVYRGERETREADVTAEVTVSGDIEDHDGVKRAGPGGADLLIPLQSSIPAWSHALDLQLRLTYLRIDRKF